MSLPTQSSLPIVDIHDNMVVLKDGSVAVVLESGAVNFDLLSEGEQMAIIDSFAGFLNSLSFMIQIVIRSERLDITSYLENLKQAQSTQTNPLLAEMMQRYRIFISKTIKENEVLDKQFYIVVMASYLELGFLKNSVKDFKRAEAILIPRREHIIRQFSRIGLKVSQLDNQKLVKLYYSLFNQSYAEESQEDQPQVAQQPSLGQPVIAQAPQPTLPPQPQKQVTLPQPPTPNQNAPQNDPQYQTRSSNHAPFVVEELPDEYGTA